jgi:hypothetical protein
MKKRAIFIFLILGTILILGFTPLISAVEFTMNANYSQGETLIAKVSGNFINQISKSNVVFYEGHVRIPMQSDVINANGDYYIYAVLAGKPTGDYSLSIENAKYMMGAEVSQETLVKNFSINNETADFSINPGAVSASGEFSFEVQNLQDSPITIDVKTSENSSGEREILILSAGNLTETSFSLKSGEKKEITFKPGIGDKTLRKIKLSSTKTVYNVPVYLATVLEGNQVSSFVLEPSSLSYSFSTNSVFQKTVYLYNNGNTEIKDIELSLDNELVPLLNLSVVKVNKLSANSKIAVNLTFYSKTEVSTLGNIKAKSGENIAYSSLTIRFIKNYTAVSSNETIQSSAKTCEELSGTICTSTQECSQEPLYAKDNLCCLSTCKEIKKSNSGIIIAVVIILLIVGVGVWFYFAKFKKIKKSPVNFVDIAKGKKTLN